MATARSGTYDGARSRSRTAAQLSSSSRSTAGTTWHIASGPHNVLHILLTVAALGAGLASRTPTYKEVPA